jgi:aldoxime dehydratase
LRRRPAEERDTSRTPCVGKSPSRPWSANITGQKADLTRDEQIEFFERVETSLIDPDGPETHEIMRFTDEAGETNAVVVAYWLDATRHARWSQAAGFPKWFSAPERCSAGEIGYWRETIAVPYNRPLVSG